jgi:hypothetical protein
VTWTSDFIRIDLLDDALGRSPILPIMSKPLGHVRLKLIDPVWPIFAPDKDGSYDGAIGVACDGAVS